MKHNNLHCVFTVQLYGACGVVTGVPNDQDIVVSFLNGVFILIADTVTKVCSPSTFSHL